MLKFLKINKLMIILIIINIYLITNSIQDKIVLYDSTKYKEDLNWLKLSYIDNSSFSNKNDLNEINFQNSIINSNDNLYGWKESSYSPVNVDDIWRIYFVCDLSVKNIQNWLFTPYIQIKQINRLQLNLTYTIRDCERLQSQQQSASRGSKYTCREKFELYYEEISENEYYEQSSAGQVASTENTIDIDKSINLLNKLKHFNYYETYLTDKSNLNRNKNGDYITNQIRDFPMKSANTSTTSTSYIRFGVRDTGSCVSLLNIEISYSVCPKSVKYGITFPETPTGMYLTDFIYVNGNCPLYSISTQIPKAICTSKGEWLITDQNLSNNCLCLPGYEYKDDNCTPCKAGTYKRFTGNQQQCISCPVNSWSFRQGAEKCECLKNFYRDNEYNASADCKEMYEIDGNNFGIDYLNADNSVNVTYVNTNYKLKCVRCETENEGAFDCKATCINDDYHNNSVLLKNTVDSRTYKLSFSDDGINLNSTLNLSLNNLKNIESEFGDSMIKFKNLTCNTETNCYNITIYLNNTSYLIRNKDTHNYRLKLYALNSLESQYKLIRLVNITKQQFKIFKHLTVLHCNYDKSVRHFKIQIEFIQVKQLNVYFYDVNFNSLCGITDTITSDTLLRNGGDSNRKALGSVSSGSSEAAPTNRNFNVILPVLLSFVLVTFLIFVILIFKRIYTNNKTKLFEKKCKFENLFSPINKSNTSSTSCSHSTSESTTSSTHSTTLTHMLSLPNSKLYYLDPHTYEDPCLTIQNFTNEIEPCDIQIESVIGGGEFGDVCKGKLRVSSANKWITVAIKTLKPNSSEKSRCDFLTEASIMSQFHHENIIYLEGVITKSAPYMIVTEFMDNGSLDQFLRLNSWRLNIENLVRILRDIACGMRYLADLNFVHRDLAARNILVTKDLCCKVADFGLSRELENDEAEGAYWTKGGKIPVRWTAPEAISFRKFTTSSDVWSYGVLCWEVMSYGERPYWNWSNQDVIKAVERGFRLPSPPGCPIVIYELMFKCWNMDRLLRPKFKDLVNNLDLISSKKDLLYSFSSQPAQTSYTDVNKPNVAQLTSIEEWLKTLSLTQYIMQFKQNNYLSLSQCLNLTSNELYLIGIFNQIHQISMLQSIKNMKQEIALQNGCLV